MGITDYDTMNAKLKLASPILTPGTSPELYKASTLDWKSVSSLLDILLNFSTP